MSKSITTILLAFLVLPSCTYTQDRLKDVTDIIDVKGGARTRFGFGAKAEGTDFLWLGLGYSATGAEFFGRKVMTRSNPFGKGYRKYPYVTENIAFGIGAVEVGGPAAKGVSASFFGLSPFALQRFMYEHNTLADPVAIPWRVGGEIWLFFVDGGIYINFGEIFDLVAGLVGWDPSGDDGVPLGEEIFEERERKIAERKAERERAKKNSSSPQIKNESSDS